MLKLPWESVYELCPLEPRWESGRHFDVLYDEWPQTMLLACPPDALAKAVMSRTVQEYMQGKEVIFIGRNCLLDTHLERTFVRQLAMRKHLGSPVMTPFRDEAGRSYSLYLFLQPETITRIDVLNGRHQLFRDLQTEWDIEVESLKQVRTLQKLDIAVRMLWNKVPTVQVRKVLNLPRLSKANMQKRFTRYAEI